MPVLEAEEHMQRMTEIAMGSGTLERRDRERIFQGWQEAASAQEPPKPKQTEAEFKQALMFMGISLVDETSGEAV